MEHLLQTLEKHQNKTNKTHQEIIEKIDEFTDKYNLPTGITINTDEIRNSIITVTIQPNRNLIEAKHYYDTHIHEPLTEELQLKLIKILYTKKFHTNPTRTRYTKIEKCYTYHYTYKTNTQFSEMKLEDAIM